MESARSFSTGGEEDAKRKFWGTTAGRPVTTTSKEVPITIPPTHTAFLSTAVLHTLPDWCGHLSWSRVQRSRVQPGVTPHVGIAGPPPTATAVEAGQWPSECICCRRRLEVPEAIPHRNLVRVVCTHCAWRHTPVGPSMLYHNTIPSWSSVEGCSMWARHQVLRSSEHDRDLGLLCLGAQTTCQFPLRLAVRVWGGGFRG